MSKLGTESAILSFVRARDLQAQGRDIINLTLGSPDFRTPPNIVEAGRKALADGHHFYTEPKGLPALREAVSDTLGARHRCRIDPGHVLVVPGAKPIAFFAIMMLADQGTEVIVPDPGYPLYESIARFAGATPVTTEPREELGFGFSADEILSKLTPRTRLLVLNSPANPTGGVIPRAEMDALVAGLERWPNVYVLSDEIYDHFLYDGHEHVSVLDYPELRDRAIVMNGWSKTYAMTGWRLGYGIWPASLIEQAERLQINLLSCASAHAQIAGIEALRGPQDQVAAMVKAFAERRRVLVEGLSAIRCFRCVAPAGAFYAFPNIAGTGLDARTLELRLLHEAGVGTSAGASFGSRGEGFLRISYARSIEEIQEAVSRIRKFVEERLETAA